MNRLKLLFTLVLLVAFAEKPNAQPGIPAVSARQIRQLIDTCTGPTVVNFWASWCGPCIRELPYLEQQVYETSQPVKLYLVSLDFPASYPTQLVKIVKQRGYKSPVLYLSDLDTKFLSATIDQNWNGEIPASIFVDRSKGYYRFLNMQLTEPRLRLELAELLQ